jgi:hypothetical protein
MDTFYVVRVVTFVSKKPNLTIMKPFGLLKPEIITIIYIIGYGGLVILLN